MLIRLKEANLHPETHIITLRFLSLSGYEHAMDYIGRYIENNRERDYNLIQASSTGPDIYATLHFYTSEAMKKFWNEHISVYGEQVAICCSNEPVNLHDAAIYFEIPESEGIRDGKIPVRTLKLDDLEEKRQEYKRLVNKFFGVESILGRQYGPVTDVNAFVRFNWEDNENMFYNNISNFTYKYEYCTNGKSITNGVSLNMAPLYIRSIQINERKGVVTIVWKNGDVTMAKCGPNDEFDVEKGIAIAFMKHWFASTTQMNKWMREQTKDYYERTFENGFEDAK